MQIVVIRLVVFRKRNGKIILLDGLQKGGKLAFRLTDKPHGLIKQTSRDHACPDASHPKRRIENKETGDAPKQADAQ